MIPVTEQERPERPPTSGPGSGVVAWRAYAAALTGSPVESWEALSREEIIAQLDREGVEQHDEPAEGSAAPDTAPVEPPAGDEAPDDAPADEGPTRRKSSGRAVWMVPTDDGPVPEHELRGR